MVLLAEVAALPQVNIDKNDYDALDRELPEKFIPIKGDNIKPEDAKYVCIKVLDLAIKKVYRIVAVKDFVAADGTPIKALEPGGIVDAKSFIDHQDSSWLSDDSVALSTCITHNSVVKNESKLWGCLVKNSIIEKADLQSTKVENSKVKKSIALESCSIINSQINNTILKDRAHVEDSQVEDSNLNFCWVANSKLKKEDIYGNVPRVQQAKCHNYNSDDKENKANLSKQNNLFQKIFGKKFGR